MIKLIKNEWTKLWAKKATWVMFIIVVLSVFVMIAGIKSIDSFNNSNNDWKKTAQEAIAHNKEILANNDVVGQDTQSLKDEIKTNEYALKNNIQPATVNSADGFLQATYYLISFVSLFSIIVAAGIVSFEFSAGTIKMLLTRPLARWKILLSKLLTSFIFAIFLGVVLFALSYITSLVLFDTSAHSLIVENNEVVKVNALTATLLQYGLAYGSMTMSILFAFMLGTIFRSSSLAIGLTLFTMFATSTIVVLLQKYAFVKYIWFSIDDLNGIYNKTSLIPNVTYGFALSVMAVYAIIFIASSFSIFKRRDITS